MADARRVGAILVAVLVFLPAVSGAQADPPGGRSSGSTTAIRSSWRTAGRCVTWESTRGTGPAVLGEEPGAQRAIGEGETGSASSSTGRSGTGTADTGVRLEGRDDGE